MIRTGMRGIIELIRKHPKIRRILRCESPYFHHCLSTSAYLGNIRVIYTVSQKNCAFLFLSELRQISTNFNKFW